MRRSPHLPLVLALGALAACAESTVQPTPLRAPESIAASSASAPARTDAADPVLFFVRGPSASMLTVNSAPPTPLWTSRPGPTGAGMPVNAPDGHQLTLGEWMTPTERAADKCIGSGTHTVLHFSDLIPNGTYSVWQLVFKAPGFVGNPVTNRIGIGPLGPADGSGNGFRASASGEGELSVVTPAGALPLTTGGFMGACALDQFEVHYVAAYHIDGMTHGATPGPLGSWAEQVGVRFSMR